MDNATPEEWHPIPRYEGRYSLSSTGRVRNDRNGRILAGWKMKNGYRMVAIGGRSGEKLYVHQLVAEVFIGPRPDREDVRHLDGSRDNNDRSNLAYGTRSRNFYDAVEHGTHFQARKTHCGKCGLPYDEANTYRPPKGGRVCRNCSAASKRRYKARMKRQRLAEAA